MIRSPPPGPGARAEVARVEAPAGGTRPSEGRATTVLALPRSETPTQWVLYCYEGEYPGAGIPDAARYAERSGLQQLAIDGRSGATLTSDEARRAIAATAAEHETELVVHVP